MALAALDELARQAGKKHANSPAKSGTLMGSIRRIGSLRVTEDSVYQSSDHSNFTPQKICVLLYVSNTGPLHVCLD